MSVFKFISQEAFPDDPYTKEIVYLSLDDKYRVAYIRKQARNGGQFWSPMSVGVSKDGGKEYYQAFMQDSSFLEKDIKEFLEKRKWEAPKVSAPDNQFPF